LGRPTQYLLRLVHDPGSKLSAFGEKATGQTARKRAEVQNISRADSRDSDHMLGHERVDRDPEGVDLLDDLFVSYHSSMPRKE
jgi:hypothetical protein